MEAPLSMLPPLLVLFSSKLSLIPSVLTSSVLSSSLLASGGSNSSATMVMMVSGLLHECNI